MKIILQKTIALSGYCSRRKAEELIRNGQVSVNGQLSFLGDKADPETDQITINGRLISRPEKKIYIMLNKPLDYTCTNRRFKNEQNIFDFIDLPERLFTIGRLDKDSHGLVLLTNDGDLTLKLSHPRFEHAKEYEVKVRDEVINPGMVVQNLLKGVDIGEDDGIVKAADVKYLQNALFVITLTEGKKRQIRRMFDALGTRVIDLKRIKIAGLSLGNLPEGKWDYLDEEEIAYLISKK
jgi:pseudouridine synthase